MSRFQETVAALVLRRQGQHNRCSDSLRAGRIGVRGPVEARGFLFFTHVPSSCTIGTGSLSRGKAAAAWR